MGYTDFDALRLAGIPLLPRGGDILLGNVFFVNGNATGAGDVPAKGTLTEPFATIAYALSQCVANHNDTVFVLPRHTETITAAISMAKAGVALIGLSRGQHVPALTVNGAIDGISMDADECLIAGIYFPVPGTDNQTSDINIAAAKCSVIGTRHIMSQNAKNKVDGITITADAHDFLIDGVRAYNTVVEATSFISLEGACGRGEIRNCFVFDSIGFGSGAIMDEAAATSLFIHHNVFSNAKADTVVMNFVANSTGVCSFNHINGRHTTLASNVVTGTGMVFFENRACEEAAKNGAVIPAVDTD